MAGFVTVLLCSNLIGPGKTVLLFGITFGAHFPLDVVLGTIVGWQVGLFSVAVMRTTGLLPQRSRSAIDRRNATAISAPIAMPSAAPASTSSQK